jgi:kinetochore protein NDC80
MPPRPPSRRTTLGPVTANRRTSLGGGALDDMPPSGAAGGGGRKPSKQRMSMIPRMSGGGGSSSRDPSPNRRKSMAPTPSRGGGRRSIGGPAHGRKSIGGGRRQSFAPGGLPPPKPSDPRPLTDKAYVASCIRSLLSYLVSSGYEHPVSHKTLARPSGRDFNQICTFLLRRVDPTFNDGQQKFEDEVALAFKTLGYPYPISKTALVAAGSPHTWPTLLAALTWLIELLGCEEADDDDDDGDDGAGANATGAAGADADAAAKSLEEEVEVRSEKAFFRFLGDSYVAFLAGDDAKYAALEENLCEYFEGDNVKIEQDFAALTEKNRTISEDIQNLLQNGEQ